MKDERGASPWHAAYLDVSPGDTVIPTGSDSFHAGLFGGEACRVTLYTVGFLVAIQDLALGIDPANESVAETRNGFGNAWHFGDVDAGSNNHLLKLAHPGGGRVLQQ